MPDTRKGKAAATNARTGRVRVAKDLLLWFDDPMRRAATLLLLVCCFLSMGMSRKPPFTISVHSVGSPEDNPRMIFRDIVGSPPHPMILKKVPEFTQENIAAFHSFKADNGNGYGVTLKLDFRGASALEIITRANQGSILRSLVNGVGADYVMIDRPISDGIFTIWEGVPESVVKSMEKRYPKIQHLQSASNAFDMTPTTKKEKKWSLWRGKEAERTKQKEDADAAKKAAQEAPSGSALPGGAAPAPAPGAASPADIQLPQGPSTSQIPLEGSPSTPQPGGPNPPLPAR